MITFWSWTFSYKLMNYLILNTIVNYYIFRLIWIRCFWKTIVENPENHFAHWNRCRFFQASYFIIVIKNRQEKIRRQHLSHLCYNSHFCSESFKLPIFHQKNFWRHPPTQSFFGGDLSSKKVAASFETIITYDVIFLLVSH